MTLQRKFVVLLALVGATVLVNLATTYWAVRTLDRGFDSPLAGLDRTLGGLNRLKRLLWAQAALLQGETTPEARLHGSPLPDAAPAHAADHAADHEVLARLEARARDELESLESIGDATRRSGVAAGTALRTGLERAERSGAAYRSASDPPAREQSRAALLADLLQTHELIERMESRILEDTHLEVGFGRDLRARVLTIVAVSLAGVALGIVLALILLRRWVLLPVSELRLAAARLGAGDLGYRIPVRGHDELARLAGEVNAMAATVATLQDERVERERLAAVGEMVRRIAHNLRNPLAGIRSLAELSRSDLDAQHPARAGQDRIIRTVDQFEGWLRGLLNVTRPLALHPEEVDIRPWLERVAEAHRPMGEARGVRLEVACDPEPRSARFDPLHLEQAVSALLTNAVQATPPGGRVRVMATLGPVAGRWRLIVADDGPGVAQEVADRLFAPYVTTKPDGTGIGLALVRQVVEQHGGSAALAVGGVGSGSGILGLDDHPGGACFVLTLPILGKPEPARAETRHIGAPGGQNSHHRG